MKKILSLIIGMVVGVNAFAIDTVVTWTNGAALRFTNVIDGRAQIQLLTVVNNINLANDFQIYDAPLATNSAAALNLAVVGQNVLSNSAGVLCYSNAAYSSIFQYTTNIKVFYTNAMGLTNFQVLGGTYTNNPVYQSNVLWTGTNTVAGGLIPYRLLYYGTIGGNATLTITNAFNVVRGLLYATPTVASNTVNVTWSSGL